MQKIESSAAWSRIQSLDLKKVGEKLQSRKGMLWNLINDVDKIEKEYRQFLYLIAVNPNKTIVPWSQRLDDFWHEHILDTKKYVKDCDDVFGKYIHHNPHFSGGSSETKVLYKKAFSDKAKKQKSKSSYSSDNSSPGCGAVMPIVFCSTCSSGSGSCSSSSGGSSCGSSCGGGGCGGGGD